MPRPNKSQKSIDDAAQVAKAAAVSKPARTGATVTVGCKMPHGLVLRLQRKEKVRYPVMGGGFKEEDEYRPLPNSPVITIHGTDVPHGQAPRCLIVHGYAMTSGVPKEFFELWLEQNKDLDAVVNGMIIANESLEDVKAEAQDNRDVKSGLEAINPKSDARMPKKRDLEGKVVDAIETATERPAAA